MSNFITWSIIMLHIPLEVTIKANNYENFTKVIDIDQTYSSIFQKFYIENWKKRCSKFIVKFDWNIPLKAWSLSSSKVTHFYDLSGLVGCWSSVSIRRIIYKFLNVCPFDYTAVAVSGKVERSLTGLTTPAGWLLLLQLTVLSRSAIVV